MSDLPPRRKSQTSDDPEPEVISHPPAQWNHYRTESSRGQLLRDLVAMGMREDHAREQVDKDFAKRGRRRHARAPSPPPQTPTPPITQRATGYSMPSSMNERAEIPYRTRKPSPARRTGDCGSCSAGCGCSSGVSSCSSECCGPCPPPRAYSPPRARSPRPYKTSTIPVEIIDPRPQRRHSPSRGRSTYSPQPPRRHHSPTLRRLERSPSPPGRYRSPTSLPRIRSPSPLRSRSTRPHSPSPTRTPNESSTDQWAVEMQAERIHKERFVLAHGDIPAEDVKRHYDRKYPGTSSCADATLGTTGLFSTTPFNTEPSLSNSPMGSGMGFEGAYQQQNSTYGAPPPNPYTAGSGIQGGYPGLPPFLVGYPWGLNPLDAERERIRRQSLLGASMMRATGTGLWSRP